MHSQKQTITYIPDEDDVKMLDELVDVMPGVDDVKTEDVVPGITEVVEVIPVLLLLEVTPGEDEDVEIEDVETGTVDVEKVLIEEELVVGTDDVSTEDVVNIVVVSVTILKQAKIETWNDIGSSEFFLFTVRTTSTASGCCGKRTTFLGFSSFKKK
jgi:hypothetical protein